MVSDGMGLLDIPRGLISHLPLIGGSGESKNDADDSAKEDEEPVAEAPEKPDEADEPEEAETPVEPEKPDETPDEPNARQTDADESEDEPDKRTAESDADSKPDSESDGDSDTEDISGTTAPSIGPNTVIEKDSPEERLARHEQSDQDAMGLDKRRQVIGGSYSASFGKQITRWLAVVVVVAAAAFGLKLLVDDLDQPPSHVAAKAPWSGNDKPPAPLE